jgi:hypothetical protein
LAFGTFSATRRRIEARGDAHIIILERHRLVAAHLLGDLGASRPAKPAIFEIDDRAIVGLEQVTGVEIDHPVRPR